MRPAAVLFDFDGVVVDSLRYHLDAWNKATNLFFGQQLSTSMSAQIMGHATQTIGVILAEHFGVPTKAEELAEAKRRFLVEIGVGIPVLPGAREAFKWLAAAGIPFGIASNAPRLYIEHLLHSHGMSAKVVMGIEDSQAPKPSPEPYLVCAKRLAVAIDDHKNTLVFEDSVHGLEAAKRAGMIPVGVTTQHSSETLREGGASLTCESIADAMAKGWLTKIPAR